MLNQRPTTVIPGFVLEERGNLVVYTPDRLVEHDPVNGAGEVFTINSDATHSPVAGEIIALTLGDSADNNEGTR